MWHKDEFWWVLVPSKEQDVFWMRFDGLFRFRSWNLKVMGVGVDYD